MTGFIDIELGKDYIFCDYADCKEGNKNINDIYGL
jgi:hypothetical protein